MSMHCMLFVQASISAAQTFDAHSLLMQLPQSPTSQVTVLVAVVVVGVVGVVGVVVPVVEVVPVVAVVLAEPPLAVEEPGSTIALPPHITPANDATVAMAQSPRTPLFLMHPGYHRCVALIS